MMPMQERLIPSRLSQYPDLQEMPLSQNVVHKLKVHNVEVIFDEQKLSSFNRNSGMVLNMMATVAEHESRSISKNIRWSLEK